MEESQILKEIKEVFKINVILMHYDYIDNKKNSIVFSFVDKYFDSDFEDLEHNEKIKLAQNLSHYALDYMYRYKGYCLDRCKKCSLLGEKIYLSLIPGSKIL